MPFRPSMTALLHGRRVQEARDLLRADREAAHSSVRYGLQRRQELAARLACRPDPSPIDVATIAPPTGKKVS